MRKKYVRKKTMKKKSPYLIPVFNNKKTYNYGGNVNKTKK